MANLENFNRAFYGTHGISTFRKKRRHIIIGLFLSFLLAYFLFNICQTSNSILLFNIALFQSGLVLSFFLALIKSLTQATEKQQGLHLCLTLLAGFFLSLSTRFTFIETYTRISAPEPVHALKAIMAMLLIVSGDLILISLLRKVNIQSFVFGILHLPFRQLVSILLVAALLIFLIHLTNLYFLDTVLALISALPFLFVTAFVMVNAYWRIQDIDKISIQRN